MPGGRPYSPIYRLVLPGPNRWLGGYYPSPGTHPPAPPWVHPSSALLLTSPAPDTDLNA